MYLLLYTDLHFSRLGGVEAQTLGNICAVRGVFMDTQLDALPKLLQELVVVNLLP